MYFPVGMPISTLMESTVGRSHDASAPLLVASPSFIRYSFTDSWIVLLPYEM